MNMSRNIRLASRLPVSRVHFRSFNATTLRLRHPHVFEDFLPLDRSLKDFLHQWKQADAQSPNNNNKTNQWKPRVDVRESEDRVIVTAELAGLTQNDVKVEINEDILSIQGEKKFEKYEKEGYTLIERRYGKFTRKFPLSNTIDKQNIQAKLENGLLEVVLPKLKPQASIHIQINVINSNHVNVPKKQ